MKIKEFRNLKDFEILFSRSAPASAGSLSQPREFKSHAVIGQNATGKSNFLEALITIFRDLDLNNVADLEYELDYSIRGHRIRNWLLEQFHNKCWYTEAQDAVSSFHVDHFRPKTRALDLEGNACEGYWWLAFEWTNYRISGQLINVKKKDLFPIVEGPRTLPLPDLLSFEDLSAGRSEIRNRVLALLFKDMKLIEAWGSGIQKMKTELKDYPEIELVLQEAGHAFQVQFVKKGRDGAESGQSHSQSRKARYWVIESYGF